LPFVLSSPLLYPKLFSKELAIYLFSRLSQAEALTVFPGP
jgi:hypothetical protein